MPWEAEYGGGCMLTLTGDKLPWGAGINHRELSLAYVRDLLAAREDSGDDDHQVHNEIGMLNVA